MLTQVYFGFCRFYVSSSSITHRMGGNQKRSCQSMNKDQKELDTVFVIAICRLTIENSVPKHFDLHSSIVLTFTIASYPVE